MSPTWLEIAVALVLLWIAWRLALLLTPLVLKRFRERRGTSVREPQDPKPKEVTAVLHNRGNDKS